MTGFLISERKNMKRFNRRVRWEFKLSLHGYGKNIREALLDALQNTEYELVQGGLDLDAIETHETISVDESDYLEHKPPESKL